MWAGAGGRWGGGGWGLGSRGWGLGSRGREGGPGRSEAGSGARGGVEGSGSVGAGAGGELLMPLDLWLEFLSISGHAGLEEVRSGRHFSALGSFMFVFVCVCFETVLLCPQAAVQ